MLALTRSALKLEGVGLQPVEHRRTCRRQRASFTLATAS